MKEFMNENFLLTNETAVRLFREHAENCPIIDYHNHLNAREIYQRRRYDNLTQVWLEADHYKWRCMRVCGVAEEYVTGGADDYAKFAEFARIMPKLIGSPVYHWAHLELQRYFGYYGMLNKKTADEVWNLCNAKLTDDSMTARNIILEGKTVLGIELGSTRIKGVLIDDCGEVLAVGAFDWENSLVNGIWTYAEEEFFAGLAGTVIPEGNLDLAYVGFSQEQHG